MSLFQTVSRRIAAFSISLLYLATMDSAAAAQKPRVEHQPIPVAGRGRPLTIRATVTGDAKIKAVNFYYSLSRDATPVQVPMTVSEADQYYGAIEGAALASLTNFSYYIEAEDADGMVTETRWYEVAVRDPSVVPPPPSPEGGLPLGWVAGGAAVAVGGGLLMANGQGGGGDGGGGTDPGAAAGTYAGTAFTVFKPESGATTDATTPCTITIDSKGRVLSDNLYPGQALVADLQGSTFTLTAAIDEGTNNVTGEIVYTGTVADQQIKGTIEGVRAADTPEQRGVYKGYFTATRQ